MKYTHLPPQKAPKLLTAYRPNQSLGEHLNAFMSRHNKRSWVVEEAPEKTFSDEIYALAAVLLSDVRKYKVPKGVGSPKRVPRIEARTYDYGKLDSYMQALFDESRDAALSLFYIHQPLNDSEYVARRTRFLADDPEFLKETSALRRNLIATNGIFTYRGCISEEQLKQMVDARGLGSDVDPELFTKPIKDGYLKGKE